MTEPWWRHPRVALVAVGLLLAGLVATVIARRGEVGLDDVFITYRYAQNLAEGQGFVFNPGERVFGTTAPGFGLMLAGLHRVTGVPIPWLGAIATGFAVLVLGLALFAAARPLGRGLEALGGALLLATTSYLWIHAGSEIPFALALLVIAGLVVDRWPVAAGLVAGFAVWCRPDALLGAGVVGVLEWWTRRRLPWRYGLGVGVVVALGLALAWSWFGVPLPSTLEAKRVQASLGTQFWASGFAFWGTAYQSLNYLVEPAGRFAFFFFGLLGWAPLLVHGGRAGRVLGGTALVLLGVYPLLAVPFYTWYSLPVVITLCFGYAFALGELMRRCFRFFGGGSGAVFVTAVVVLALFGPSLGRLGARSWGGLTHRAYDPRYHFYREIGEWLAAQARPGDALAFVEVGTLAFYSRLPVRDQLGLVTPESLPFLGARDIVGAFLAAPTSLFLFDERLGGFTKDVAAEPWFAAAYGEAQRFTSAATNRTLVVYRRRPDVPIPPPRPPRQRETPR